MWTWRFPTGKFERKKHVQIAYFLNFGQFEGDSTEICEFHIYSVFTVCFPSLFPDPLLNILKTIVFWSPRLMINISMYIYIYVYPKSFTNFSFFTEIDDETSYVYSS